MTVSLSLHTGWNLPNFLLISVDGSRGAEGNRKQKHTHEFILQEMTSLSG